MALSAILSVHGRGQWHPNELKFWLHKKTHNAAGTRISSDFGAKKQFWAYFNGQLHIFKHIHWLKLINNLTCQKHDLKVSDKFEGNLKLGHGELRRSKKTHNPYGDLIHFRTAKKKQKHVFSKKKQGLFHIKPAGRVTGVNDQTAYRCISCHVSYTTCVQLRYHIEI